MTAPSFFQTYSPRVLPRESPSGIVSPCQPAAAPAGPEPAIETAMKRTEAGPRDLRIVDVSPFGCPSTLSWGGAKNKPPPDGSGEGSSTHGSEDGNRAYRSSASISSKAANSFSN